MRYRARARQSDRLCSFRLLYFKGLKHDEADVFSEGMGWKTKGQWLQTPSREGGLRPHRGHVKTGGHRTSLAGGVQHHRVGARVALTMRALRRMGSQSASRPTPVHATSPQHGRVWPTCWLRKEARWHLFCYVVIVIDRSEGTGQVSRVETSLHARTGWAQRPGRARGT
jgi:hypothetical protein